MDKHINTFLRLETPRYLLVGLDAVGLRMRKQLQINQHNTRDVADALFQQPLTFYVQHNEYIGLNLAACNLLAAILEGSLRALFGELIHRDSVNIGEMSAQFAQDDKKYKAITRAYGRLKHLSDATEFNGGWNNLKDQYRDYLGVKLDDLLPDHGMQGINGLFTLRNASAHGTQLVAPLEKLKDKTEGEYAFKWQSKLQSLSVYVQKSFDMPLFKALAHPCFAAHFSHAGSQMISQMQCQYGPFTSHAAKQLDKISEYTFGHDNTIL